MRFKVGFEKEFYLSSPLKNSYLSHINNSLKLTGSKLENERGKNQYELIIQPLELNLENEIASCLDDIVDFYERNLHTFLNLMDYYNINVNDSPKPDRNDYGSALQISFSSSNLNNKQYLNFIYCILQHSKEFNRLINAKSGLGRLIPGFMSPTHICWGGNNNRTTLVRAVDLEKQEKTRVEYRGANSDSCVRSLSKFILEMFLLSKSKIYPSHPKIWGNSYDKQYNLESLI